MTAKIIFRIFLFLIFSTILASCSKKIYQVESIGPIVFPPPPDTARIQFLTRYSSSNDLKKKKSTLKSFVIGEEGARTIYKPYGMSIYNNKLFVVDAAIAGMHIINLEENSFKYFIPQGRGQLQIPINSFIDVNGDIYVTDVNRKQVVIFNEKHDYIGAIGGENFKPADVTIKGDTIYITDPLNNRINAYDKNSRKLLFRFPEGGAVGDKKWLYNPLNLCVYGDTIYITDFGDSQVKMFTMDGDYITSVGGFGAGKGQFVRPKGIAVDREQILYSVDAGFENVQMFNKEGQLLMFFGGPYKKSGDMYLPANVIIDYDHLSYYEKYVDPAYRLKYLIFVTNQYGPDKVSVYGRIEAK